MIILIPTAVRGSYISNSKGTDRSAKPKPVIPWSAAAKHTIIAAKDQDTKLPIIDSEFLPYLSLKDWLLTFIISQEV